MPTRDCCAISLSVLERPPRVGSRMQRMPRVTSSIAATSLQGALNRFRSGFELHAFALGQNRNTVIADRSAQNYLSPGRARSAES